MYGQISNAHLLHPLRIFAAVKHGLLLAGGCHGCEHSDEVPSSRII
eukprot:COSAG01_NODE_2567_length_7445_cov_1.752655_3_plen_45_part_01